MWEKWLRLPLSIRILIVILALVAMLAVIALFDLRAAWFVLAALIVIALLLGGFVLFRQWQRKRASAKFSKGLGNVNVFSPGALADPSQRARLQDLRHVFEKGVKAFSDAGKDLYSLPWYLVCGEPGSGKTETIRHSNIGFPPGLQDEMQGVGGTINMHWWFTNHAIMLDTAGKMLFHEAQPGATSEWIEFLNLLKTHRRNCPINGLLLVIPADSLLRDNADEIQRKAGRIVRQLDQIQKVLDVRFPVFVLLTKCDLIYGFREFFSNVRDARVQQQMLGWSNPEPLDVPFRPDLVTTHIEQIAERLRRRRLLLMRDPIPAASNGRRLDEVDSFFDFPASITGISARLKQYLDVVFVAGEWTKKPLFLRGIYFTSALIEGSALDVELASALGIPVDHLPDQKSWDRNRSFFLRDLFLQKIFREKGLVTGASDTRAVVRRRTAILGAVGAACLAVLMLVTWVGASALKRSVVSELDQWQAAASGWENGRWRPILVPGDNSAEWKYTGDGPVLVGSRAVSLLSFHQQLETLASREIQVPWVFKPMENLVAGTNVLRRQAQEVVFEASVIEPLISSVRSTLRDQTLKWDDINAQRMALLLRLEGLIDERARNAKAGVSGKKIEPDAFFHATLQPWLGLQPVPHELVRLYDLTLFRPGRQNWPGAWLSGGRTLEENRALAEGWTSFSNAIRNVRTEQQLGVDQIRNTRVAVELHLSREKEFMRAVHNTEGDRWQLELDTAYEAMAASRSTVEEMLNRTAVLEGMPSSLFTLQSAYQAMFEHARSRSRTAAKLLAQASAVPEGREGDPNVDLPLYAEVRRRLAEAERAIDEAYQQSLTPGEMSSIPKLDMEATVPAAGSSDRVYAYRFAVYRDLIAQMYARSEGASTLIGHLGDALQRQQAALSAVNARSVKYEGELRSEFLRTARALMERASASGPVNLVEKHSRELEQLLVAKAGFPIMRGAGSMKEAQMRDFCAELQKLSKDAAIDSVPGPAKPGYSASLARMNQVIGFVRSVARPTGEGSSVKVCVASLADQRRLLERIAPGLPFAEAFAGNRFRSLRVGDKAVRTQAAMTSEVLTLPCSEGFPELEFFFGAETKSKSDGRAVVGGTWAALRLIAQEKHSVPVDGGRTWLCPVEVVAGESRSYFVLGLQFEQPVPSVEQWP